MRDHVHGNADGRLATGVFRLDCHVNFRHTINIDVVTSILVFQVRVNLPRVNQGLAVETVVATLSALRSETRIVIDLDRAASGKVAADGSDGREVMVNLPGVNVDGDLQGAGQGLVKAWTVERTATGARLGVELTGSAVIKRRFLLPPADGVANYRYVIDLGRELAPLSDAERKAAGTVALSADQADENAALDRSARLRAILGDPAVNVLVAVRRYEHETYSHLDAQQLTDKFRMAWSL